jgi:hypothetical protein
MSIWTWIGCVFIILIGLTIGTIIYTSFLAAILWCVYFVCEFFKLVL